MKEVIDFFRRLHDDNTREWFDAHRAEWTRVKGRFADFTGQLIGGIASFDPEVRGLRPQDCTPPAASLPANIGAMPMITSATIFATIIR